MSNVTLNSFLLNAGWKVKHQDNFYLRLSNFDALWMCNDQIHVLFHQCSVQTKQMF